MKHCVDAGLKQLPHRHILFDHLAANGSLDQGLESGRRFYQRIGVGDAQHPQSGFRRRQIPSRLHLGRFSLLQILFGNCMMLVQVLGTRVRLLCQRIGISGLQVIGAELGIVRACHVQHRLALLHPLAGNHHDPAHRAADLRDHRRCMKAVVGHRSGQPEGSRQAGWLDREHLHVGHLVRRDGEQFSSIGVVRIILGAALRTCLATASIATARSLTGPSARACSAAILGIFTEGSSFRRLLSIAPTLSCKRTMPGDRPVEWPGYCVQHRENPIGSSPHVYKHTH